uniref:Panacea domain-containing protein n=1 Tax=Flavobacterium sp. TaxID=239 RepID=UPI004048EEDA
MIYVIIFIMLFVISLYFLTLQDNFLIVNIIYSKNNMSYSSTTIANYFIRNYSKYGDLTPMKVIKMTYLSYSWYLALTNGEKKLIEERLEAWDYGPVFPNLYQNIKNFGKTIINDSIPSSSTEIIDMEDAKFLDKIWSMYGKFDGVQLSAMTHSEGTPWKNSYCYGCNSEIEDTKILNHYLPKLKPAIDEELQKQHI